MTRQRLSVHSKGSLREPTKQLRDSFQHHARNHLFTLLVAKQERIPEASPKILWEAFKKDRLCCFPLILWNVSNTYSRPVQSDSYYHILVGV